MEIRENLKVLMAKHNMLPSVLSEKSGLTMPILHRIISGENTDPKLSTLKKLATGLGVTVSQLIGETSIPN